MSGPRALLFDFDGIIVESEHIKSRAFATLYREHGEDVVRAVVAHHEANGGISRRKKLRWAHRTLLGIELTDTALDELGRQFSELVEDEVVACDWVPGALEVLQAQSGRRPMFIVSGTPHEELGRIISRRGLSRYFEEVHGSPPEKTPIIRDILARWHLAPGEALFVGDAAADHRAAVETGVPFIGRIGDGRRSPFPPDTAAIRDLSELVL